MTLWIPKTPLPPLAEQKRIVKKLDTLAGLIRELRTLQTTQLANLKSLKQSILHEVFWFKERNGLLSQVFEKSDFSKTWTW